MKSRQSIAANMEAFYKKTQDKQKGLKSRLQTDLEFKQKEIFELNKKYNFEMFSTAILGEKAFAAEQKLRELKKRIFRFKALERKILGGKKIRPYEIIKKPVKNMNSNPSAKYKQVPENVKKNALASEASREKFNFVGLRKKFEKKKIRSKDLTQNLPEKKTKAKIFARGGRRSPRACL